MLNEKLFKETKRLLGQHSHSSSSAASTTWRKEVLKIEPLSELQQERYFKLPGIPNPPVVPEEAEEGLLLSDVYGSGGRLRGLVMRDDVFLPLIYTYDFGDNWEHKLFFKSSTLARANRPLFSSATGCGPVDDCGGTYGWEEVKAAFRALGATSASTRQRELITWAKEQSGLGEAFDPFAVPDVVQMNYEGRWENHSRAYIEGSGEPVEDFEDDEDFEY